LRLGHIIQALKFLTRATELEPRDNQAWYNKAQAEARLNRRQDAKRSFVTFLELALPDDVEHIENAKNYIISN
jgi:Flp pilus assembly protein TadD